MEHAFCSPIYAMLVSRDGHRAAQLGLRGPAQPSHPRKKIRSVFLIVSDYLLSKQLVLDVVEYPVVPAGDGSVGGNPFCNGTIKAS